LLGIPPKDWNEPIFRVDLEAANQRNLRLATGKETGANPLWEPGGKTSGGMPEAVIDPVPKDELAGKSHCAAG
jgi:hypothetical protein